jgi:pyruvate formate lyase activating enzyme
VCPGGTGAGYPTFARRPGPEAGFANLAVFYEACSFDCLFCQNWHFRQAAPAGRETLPADLATRADDHTTCICFFGGDPSPQLVHSLWVARLARKRARGRILRICWETNGSMHPRLLDRAVDVALESGGCLKFDLKAWDEGVHRALTGVSNAWTRRNFGHAAARARARPVPPALVASTLLVPGYVDAGEVARIARFVAEQDPDIPYSLLAFHPCFLMGDLRITSRREALAAAEAARAAGLRRVRLGNEHLLRDGT